jgi:hypothetical protein
MTRIVRTHSTDVGAGDFAVAAAARVKARTDAGVVAATRQDRALLRPPRHRSVACSTHVNHGKAGVKPPFRRRADVPARAGVQ